MRITKETDYAIRALSYLVESKGKLIEAKEIAENQSIPPSFLFKVLRKLVTKELIISIRGIGGGYKLKKSPEEISLLDIIVAIEEEATLNSCLGRSGSCLIKDKKGYCKAHRELSRIQCILQEELGKKSLEEILK